MNTALAITATVAALGVIGIGFWTLLRLYLTFRGTRVVTCPETGKRAAVEVNARRAAVTTVVGSPELRVRDCTRWPERRHCGQECLTEIETAPADCLVRSILAKWYAGRACVLCGKPIGEINWLAHEPALMDAAGYTFAWRDLPAERIFDWLATHRPVCWNCHIAETFRHEHPELVVDRPEHTHV